MHKNDTHALNSVTVKHKFDKLVYVFLGFVVFSSHLDGSGMSCPVLAVEIT